MRIKAKRIVIAFLVAIVFATTNAGTSVADQPEETEEILIYCVAWANLPYKSGSVIYGKGGARCTTTVASLRIRVQLRDKDKDHDPPRSATVNKTCYNTDRCEATASLSHNGHSGHCYDTAVSAWFGLYSSYDQSIEVCFP